MKNKINIFSNNKIKFFLTELFSDYELIFMNLDEIEKKTNSTNANIIFINEEETSKLINFKKLSDNFLILSSSNNINLKINNKLIKTPMTINHIKNTIENFLTNLKIQFHDIIIFNEKLTNFKNNSFCYLTKFESEILTHLIMEKETHTQFVN